MGTHSNYVQDRFKTDKSNNSPVETQQVVNFRSHGTEETNNISRLDKRAVYTKRTNLWTAVLKQVIDWARVPPKDPNPMTVDARKE